MRFQLTFVPEVNVNGNVEIAPTKHAHFKRGKLRSRKRSMDDQNALKTSEECKQTKVKYKKLTPQKL